MDEYPYHLMVKEDEPACGARDDKALTYRVDVANCPACLRSSLRAAEERAEAAERERAALLAELDRKATEARGWWGDFEAAERRAEGLEGALADAMALIEHAWDEPRGQACGPWCNGVHEQGVCEGTVYANEMHARARAALARPRSEETPTSPDNANREE